MLSVFQTLDRGLYADAPPGREVLWRGMTRLAVISEAYRIYTRVFLLKCPRRSGLEKTYG